MATRRSLGNTLAATCRLVLVMAVAFLLAFLLVRGLFAPPCDDAEENATSAWSYVTDDETLARKRPRRVGF